ncbi:MAG: glutamyl-tRNA reductase [Microscillaceae bacterium]
MKTESMNHFKIVSLTYKNTPLAIRELLALDGQACLELAQRCKDWEDISDILVLSTCNRTEVYYLSPIDYSYNIICEILALKNISPQAHYQDYFTRCNDHYEAVEHLFEVALGLDSQVVGDMQITNQVKQAYQLSADLNLAGPFLHRLLHTIFFTNKRVVQETAFRSGAASTSYATVELIEDFARQLSTPNILVLGIGEIGADVCRNLVGKTNGTVRIANRTFSKAAALAQECNFTAIDFAELPQALAEADVVISSIARSEPFITRAMLQDIPLLSYKYFIDLAVPRSIDPAIEQLPGILLYNIDQINNRAGEALQKRLAAVPDVRAIITQSAADFHEWAKEMEISPTLQKLKNTLEQIRREEVQRFAKKLKPAEAQLVDKITRNMMQKILKLPALHLKAACKRGEAETLIDVLNNLFNLEKEPEKAKIG